MNSPAEVPFTEITAAIKKAFLEGVLSSIITYCSAIIVAIEMPKRRIVFRFKNAV